MLEQDHHSTEIYSIATLRIEKFMGSTAIELKTLRVKC